MANMIPRKSGGEVLKSDEAYITPGTLYVGTQGNLCVLLAEDPDSDDSADGTVYVGVSGDFPRVVRKVFSTLTTASDIVLDAL